MSELAFNMNGEPFEVPAAATGWRVRRMKTKGAPEVVYGREGTPLVLPLDAAVDDLRNAVGVPGRYRLDPVEDCRAIENAPAAYVFLHNEESSTSVVSSGLPARSDNIVIEALRMNTEITKTVVERFAQVMEAAAVVLRAADGAGLPARVPQATNDEEDDEEDDEVGPSNASPTFELINNLVAQIVPVIVTSLASRGMPKLGSVLDWRKARPTASEVVEEKPAAMEMPPLDAAAMAKVMQIQAQLTPAEQARARLLAAELSPTELREWFAELSALEVADALAKIRSLLGGAQ